MPRLRRRSAPGGTRGAGVRRRLTRSKRAGERPIQGVCLDCAGTAAMSFHAPGNRWRSASGVTTRLSATAAGIRSSGLSSAGEAPGSARVARRAESAGRMSAVGRVDRETRTRARPCGAIATKPARCRVPSARGFRIGSKPWGGGRRPEKSADCRIPSCLLPARSAAPGHSASTSLPEDVPGGA